MSRTFFTLFLALALFALTSAFSPSVSVKSIAASRSVCLRAAPTQSAAEIAAAEKARREAALAAKPRPSGEATSSAYLAAFGPEKPKMKSDGARRIRILHSFVEA
jgi:hypothetical protein